MQSGSFKDARRYCTASILDKDLQSLPLRRREAFGSIHLRTPRQQERREQRIGMRA
jgi:hypothetical protein